MNPVVMSIVRGAALAVLIGAATFLKAWNPDDAETVNNAVQAGLAVAVAVLVARFGEGAYDQYRANNGKLSDADVPIAAMTPPSAAVQRIESERGAAGVTVVYRDGAAERMAA